MTATPTLPPARVIELWNQVAEDTGGLTTTLLRFAQLLLAEADSGAARNGATDPLGLTRKSSEVRRG